MKKRELIKRSLVRCDQLRSRYPNLLPVESLRKQLDYLLELEEGRSTDRSRLGELTIGVITAREIEDRDPGLADLLYRLLDAL